MKMKYWLIIIVIVLIAFMFWLSKIDFMLPEGYAFCKNKGFDAISFSGSYSEKFGKVECYSSYKDNRIYEEFNVTKRFGIILDAEDNKGNGR